MIGALSCKEIDFAWACGLFEGEGSVTNKDYGERLSGQQRRLTLGTTDGDVVRKFASIMGGKVYGPYMKANPKWKPIYIWHECEWDQVKAIAEAMIPYMGERRRLALEELLTNPPRGTLECRNGHAREYSVIRKGKLVCQVCELDASERKRNKKRKLSDQLCECGCGQQTFTSKDTGLPNRFLHGHQRRHNSLQRFSAT